MHKQENHRPHEVVRYDEYMLCDPNKYVTYTVLTWKNHFRTPSQQASPRTGSCLPRFVKCESRPLPTSTTELHIALSTATQSKGPVDFESTTYCPLWPTTLIYPKWRNAGRHLHV